jgi:hypothetical protein
MGVFEGQKNLYLCGDYSGRYIRPAGRVDRPSYTYKDYRVYRSGWVSIFENGDNEIMTAQIIVLAILILTCVIGIWKHFSRTAQYRRVEAEKARKEYEDAAKSGDTSRITASLNRMHRLQ